MSHYDCPCMEKCPLHYAMSLIGGKWKVQILCSVTNAGTIRYNALRGKLLGISNTVLASALRELERDGLILRREYLEVPVRVEYAPTEDCRRLLMAGGRWDPEQLLSDYRQRELRDFLPAETAQAVQQARQALAETGNGQECDLVLDGTCFRELTRLADAVDCPALTDYLRTRIDGVNLCSAVRAHRLRKGPDFLHRVLLEGGSVPPAALEESAPADLRELYAATPLREAAGLAEGICAGNGSMTALEKQCDNAVLRLAAKARRTPFGVETALGYLIAAEAELTAVRTIMTGRRAGLSADTIRERLRDIYG